MCEQNLIKFLRHLFHIIKSQHNLQKYLTRSQILLCYTYIHIHIICVILHINNNI